MTSDEKTALLSLMLANARTNSEILYAISDVAHKLPSSDGETLGKLQAATETFQVQLDKLQEAINVFQRR